ncbi:MAG: glutathione S-transferase family protein [Opitutaceae bacterium]
MSARSQLPDETTETGEFNRQEDAFRDKVSDDGAAPFAAEAGRYHLYAALACPWAHRTLIVRSLLGLDDAVSVTIAAPYRDSRGWAFHKGPRHDVDEVNGFRFLSEAYARSEPHYRGRVTVPALWDRKTSRIINNSEDDICRMFDGPFRPLGKRRAEELFPSAVASQQDELSEFIYTNINNGVYRAGFATEQAAYERAVRALFAALDQLENRLATSRYLFGSRIVESDWRLFCTLVRFDAVYHGHFKCNLRRVVDYPQLAGYLRDLYQQPGIAATVDIDHIKRHYYGTHDEINPTGIIPLGPLLDFKSPHGREHLG